MLKTAINDCDEIAGEIASEGRHRRGLVAENLGHDVVAIGTEEGRSAGSGGEEDAAESEEVGALVQGSPNSLFGADVVRCSCDAVAGDGEVVPSLDRAGDPEVCEDRGAIGSDEDVGRLEIAVEHPMAGKLSEGACAIAGEATQFADVEDAMRSDLLIEVASRVVGRDQVRRL